MFKSDGSIDKEVVMSLGIGLAAMWALHKFVKNDTVKVGAVAVAAVMVGRQVPFVRQAL